MLNNEEFKCIPEQVRKLIGFCKHYKFDEKQAASKAEIQARDNSRKKARQASETSYYGPSKDEAENEVVDHAVCKILQALNNGNAPKNGGVPDEEPKSNANAGSSFGKTNEFGGKRK